MQQFEITLKNEKLRSYYRISWLFIIINIVVFLYLSFFANQKNIRVTAVSSLVLLAICFILKYYLRNTKWQVGFHPFFLFLMSSWIMMEQYWLAAIPCIVDILLTVAVRKLAVLVARDKIVYPSFPSKTINWSDLLNVVMKDGLLTINFRNDKFIQQLIDETKTTVNEQEFNEFCIQQLTK